MCVFNVYLVYTLHTVCDAVDIVTQSCSVWFRFKIFFPNIKKKKRILNFIWKKKVIDRAETQCFDKFIRKAFRISKIHTLAGTANFWLFINCAHSVGAWTDIWSKFHHTFFRETVYLNFCCYLHQSDFLRFPRALVLTKCIDALVKSRLFRFVAKLWAGTIKEGKKVFVHLFLDIFANVNSSVD